MNIIQNLARRLNNCCPVRQWYPCFVLPSFLLLFLAGSRDKQNTIMTSGGGSGLLQGFKELEDKSKRFFKEDEKALFTHKIKKPTEHNFISELKIDETKEKIYRYANRAYPVVHADVIGIAQLFLDNKIKSGTKDEKKIYENLQVPEFMHRLLTKRPLVFINSNDYWVDKEGNSAAGDWDNKARKDLEHFLSYDEIKISALMQLSTETMLINSGGRFNAGKKGNKGSFIPEAVYVAAVGARFEKQGVMEYQDILQNENIIRKDKDMVFETYYDQKLGKTSGKDQSERFNVARYKQRMKLSFETFLLEADQRGQEQGKKVYCHVVGLGMGVWQLPGYQKQVEHWFSAFEESLETLLKNRRLVNISDIDFSWVDPGNHHMFWNGSKFPHSEIKIHVSQRDPFQKLCQEDQPKLVVAMFAWDGNAYVGNEYWEGGRMLTASGDPAAASCSFIPELLNPDINPNISGGNLHVACPKRGILSYENYNKSSMSEEKSYSAEYSTAPKLAGSQTKSSGENDRKRSKSHKPSSDQRLVKAKL